MLKSFGQILEPDSIWRGFVLRNRETGAVREKTFRDHYSSIETIQISSAAPESVREHFDVARNLFVYSWFVSDFMPVAEMHGFSSVEYAIRLKSDNLKLMLKNGLELAISKRWISDGGFRYYRIKGESSDGERVATQSSESEDVQEYCKILLDAFPYLRNTLAHGNKISHLGGLTTLAICADLINQLFESSSPHFEMPSQDASQREIND
ncbi:MAG: hypothetical protein ABL970_14220 [Nitrospira sp.]